MKTTLVKQALTGDNHDLDHRHSWCAMCERTFSEAEWKRGAGRCPGEGCKAPHSLRVSWKAVRKEHPEYPDHPESNAVYPFEYYSL
ncbi:MAG: hypothetical protein KY468_13955 [Armatimonadetes bacterium]|nr:hypothetical protein [Armatimonadota bacterium]